ncbi:MAG TPA: DNA (cytosine-5-)-methyltransferase [Rhizomicrobium sp.]
MESDPAFISLFSGAGGLDLGLEQAGWRNVYASDIDSSAIATIEANRGFRIDRRRRAFSHAFTEQADIRHVAARDILSKIGARKGGIPLLAGGPPCQSWSSAGHQHGFKDPRGRLFDDFVRLAEELDARWLLLENVRGLLTARGADGVPGSALAYIRRRLLRAGFQTAVGLFNAADFGVAQRRVRLFMLGFRAGDPPPFPLATHAKSPGAAKTRRWTTLGEALSALAPLGESEIIRPSGKFVTELAALKPGQGVKSPGKSEVTRPGGHWGYKQGAFVADLSQSARTVTANAQQDWVHDAVHGLRRLCPRECAAIQGFPQDWFFAGPRAAQYRLIGNAVPPPLARHLGASLRHHCIGKKGAAPSSFRGLLPLPSSLLSAIAYTVRDEKTNGASRKSGPRRRVSRDFADAAR